jgi:hypothetical protein
MAAYNKFQSWAENMVEVANCGSDQFVLALTAAANAPVNTNTVLANLTQVSYTNCSTRNITTNTSAQASGTYSLVVADLTLTASGGAIAAFQYVVVYDDTPTSPADPLVCWFDYGSAVTVADTETFLVDFGSSLFTVGP